MCKLYMYLSPQESVTLWLSLLGLSQYEEILLEAGYDDIDFIADITLDELIDLGITKKGRDVKCHYCHLLYMYTCKCTCTCTCIWAYN